jgi:hypothetical protein
MVALIRSEYDIHFVLIHLKTWLPQEIPVLDWSISKKIFLSKTALPK